MDTCFSGEIDDESVQLSEAGKGGKSVNIKTKSAGENKCLIKIERKKKDQLTMLKKDIFQDLRKGTGAIVITSSSGVEVSYENGDIGNGLFTYSYINGIKQLSEKNKDKAVLVSQIMNWVSEKVQELTKGAQTPTMRREQIEFDWEIY